MMNNKRLGRFKRMVTMRHFDEACLEGVPTREIHGELHTGIGQEAIGAGMAESLKPGDAVVSTHRNHYHGIAAGVPLKPMLAEIFERETGLCKGRGGHMHIFAPEQNFSSTGIVGASLPVALGYAYGFWMEGKNNVAVAVTGDGGTNNGTFHECLNIAGAWKLPFVLLVENNLLAISVPIDEVLATPTIAERAIAYKAWGKKVDGINVDTFAATFAEAVDYARSGKGPAIIEATCYRFRGHFEGDHDSYRKMEEKKRLRESYDPVELAKRKLIQDGIATEGELETIIQASRQELAALLVQVRSEPMPEGEKALDYLFA
jgi:acetoin:2,6-dichlorophenolindophenol oxidoreductase subunit alpha